MEERACYRPHINHLWSIWYGVAVSALQSYIAFNSAKRLLQWYDFPFENEDGNEIQVCLVLIGVAVLLLPLFFTSSIFKVGNFANDGYKLGRNLSTCSSDDPKPASSSLQAIWSHGGPTSSFLHLVSAFCLLLPNLLLQAKLIKCEILPKEDVWKTDLDFLVSSYDRLVVLSFMTSPISESNTTKPSTSGIIPPTPLTPQGLLQLPGRDDVKVGPVSIEFFNYALALAVYSVRYPAVFWNTNKCWGAIFSFQLFANGIQTLFIYAGVCILYKVHVVGPTGILSSLPVKLGNHFFLLNPYVTIALLVLTTCLVLSSSLVLYLYGYGRFIAFLNHEKACRVISVEGREWGYLTHCAALCVLLAITVVEGPLLVDLAVIYKSNSDSTVIFSVIAAAFHVFIWVVLWLILTIKQKWEFKLRVTVGKAAVKSARSIKLLTDVELIASCDASAPLLVVASGRTYTVCDTSPKKTIINVIHKTAMEKKAKLQEMSNANKEQLDDEEQIYWLRPKPISPKNSPDSEVSDQVTWQRKAVQKPKVTFDQSVMGPKNEGDGDDGDYARLRELPISTNKLPSQEEIYIKASKIKGQYASTDCKKLVPPVHCDYEDPSPLLTPEPAELALPPPPPDPPVMPRCLLRADSGMPNDLTPRSDSEISSSPPDHSETSSGVHSNSSRESNNAGAASTNMPPKAERIVTENVNGPQWNGNELQRDINSQNSGEVVICCRVEPEALAVPNTVQDKFSRSTNMKMVSFTDGQSATLPHFPTSQQVGVPYPHCSTMPLPPIVSPPPITHHPPNYPRHTTIPSHHNGVRLFNTNMYGKRPFVHRYPHHSFPQLMNPSKFIQKRDTANFAMASYMESDSIRN